MPCLVLLNPFVTSSVSSAFPGTDGLLFLFYSNLPTEFIISSKINLQTLAILKIVCIYVGLPFHG